MQASKWLHTMGIQNSLNVSGAICMMSTTPMQQYLEIALTYVVVHHSRMISGCSTQHQPRMMHQVIIQDMVGCSTILFAVHHGGGVGQCVMIVSL
jgi:hypothetical protein